MNDQNRTKYPQDDVLLWPNDRKAPRQRQSTGVQENKKRHFSAIAQWVGDHAGITINAFMLGGSVIAIVAVQGVQGIGGLIQRIASGDQQATILGLVTVNAIALLGLSVMGLTNVVKHGMSDDKIAQLTGNSTATFKALARSLSALDQKVRFLVETTESDEHKVSMPAMRRTNHPRLWTNFEPDSAYITINAYAQGDIEEYRDADGNLRYRANPERLAYWLQRFMGSAKLGRVEHVFLVEEEQLSGRFNPPRQVLRVLGAYKALLEIADANGLRQHLDLSRVRVRFALTAEKSSEAIFIGMLARGGEDHGPIGFVYRYNVFLMTTSAPGTIFETTVEQSYDPVDVSAYRTSAEVLIQQAVRTFTMEDMLERFAKLVPPVDPFDAMLSEEMRIGVKIDPLSQASWVRSERDSFDGGDGSFMV